MRQKITWFIPGLLVTLLLGLLWAMPAFGQDAGSISFLGSKGGSEISYVSLNGPAGETGFYLEVADLDLNAPATKVWESGGAPDELWVNLADSNGDGAVNYLDFRGFSDANDNDMRDSNEPYIDAAPENVTGLNTQAGLLTSLSLPTGATHIEYKIYSQDNISGRSATTVPSNDVRTDLADAAAVGVPTTRTGPDQDGDGTAELWDWVDVLDTNGDGRITSRDGTIDVSADDPLTGTVRNSAIMATREDDPATGDDPTTDDVNEALNPATTLINEAGTFELTFLITRGVDASNGPDGVPGGGDDVEFTEDTVVITINNVDRSVPANADTADDEDLQVANGVEVTLSYQVPVFAIGSASDRVTITSQAPNSTISLILSESSAMSGKFGVQVILCESGTDDCAVGQADVTVSDPEVILDGMGTVTIPVIAAGDTISVTYSDASPSRTRRGSIPLDVDGPSFNNMAPASGTSGREDEPTVSFTVADTDSGISDDKDAAESVYVLAALYGLNEKTNNGETITYFRDDLNLEDATSGYDASVSIEEGPNDLDADASGAGSEYEIRWWAVATDLAGNVSVSDSDGDTKCTLPASLDITSLETGIVEAVGEVGETGYVAGTGCDPHVVRVDSAGPELDAPNSFTGVWRDGSEEMSGSDAIRTSIKVAFNEALDCSTVSADDFTVDGAAPNAANCVGSSVYLDVDELDPNDKPEIEVGNEALTDKAGNLIGDLDEITVNDGIPANLSVTVTGTGEGSRPITDGDVTVMITSDERLQGNPTVTISKVTGDYLLASEVPAQAVPTGTANEWRYEPTFGNAADDGLWNVYVSATDLGGTLNTFAGTQGVEQKDAAGKGTGVFDHDPDNESAILFEVDNEVQAPAWSPDIIDDGKTDNAGVFIRAEFTNEAKEYGLGHDAGADPDTSEDDSKPMTNTPSEVVTDFDTSGTVTLVSAEFNGDDVTSDVNTRDDVLFTYRPGNLTNGEHEFMIEVMDAAGNEGTFTLEFEKVDKQSFELVLEAGPNLVSFPAAPADPDINAVFGGEGNENIMSVLSFNNQSGLWQTAMKGADGTFAGDLTTVNGMNGYWVVTDNLVDVSVLLIGGGDVTSTPPHIAVTEGWNLIGVVDTEQRQGHSFATSDYFANIDAQVVYGHEALAGRLVRLSTAKAAAGEAQDMVTTGKAYWVYANAAGIIIP